MTGVSDEHGKLKVGPRARPLSLGEGGTVRMPVGETFFVESVRAFREGARGWIEF